MSEHPSDIRSLHHGFCTLLYKNSRAASCRISPSLARSIFCMICLALVAWSRVSRIRILEEPECQRTWQCPEIKIKESVLRRSTSLAPLPWSLNERQASSWFVICTLSGSSAANLYRNPRAAAKGFPTSFKSSQRMTTAGLCRLSARKPYPLAISLLRRTKCDCATRHRNLFAKNMDCLSERQGTKRASCQLALRQRYATQDTTLRSYLDVRLQLKLLL